MMTEHPTAPDFLVRFFLNITRDEVGSGGVGSWYEHTHFIEPTRTFWFLQAWWYFSSLVSFFSRIYVEEFTKLGTHHALMLFVLHAKVHAQH